MYVAMLYVHQNNSNVHEQLSYHPITV